MFWWWIFERDSSSGWGTPAGWCPGVTSSNHDDQVDDDVEDNVEDDVEDNVDDVVDDDFDNYDVEDNVDTGGHSERRWMHSCLLCCAWPPSSGQKIMKIMLMMMLKMILKIMFTMLYLAAILRSPLSSLSLLSCHVIVFYLSHCTW